MTFQKETEMSTVVLQHHLCVQFTLFGVVVSVFFQQLVRKCISYVPTSVFRGSW